MKYFITILVTASIVISLGALTAEREDFPAPFARLFGGRSVCEEPLRYAVGSVDNQFGISRSEFRSAVKEAESVWEKGMGRELLVHDPEANFSINLVFDERQRFTQQTQEVEEELESIQGAHEDISQQYENLKAVYERQQREYRQMVTAYERRLGEYNEAVARWNERGGAPEDVYEDLQEEKQTLQEMQAQLEEKRQVVNALVTQINALARQSNELARIYNEEAQTYEQRFGTARRFNQGEYIGDKINIYQFDQTADLTLVLAHELGHALGIEHIEEPTAVMYYLMRDQNLETIALSDADVHALRTECGLTAEGDMSDMTE